MYEKDIIEFATGKINDFADGYHRLSAMGDTVIFYDFDIGQVRADTGKMEVPFFRANFPVQARKALLRYANKVWRVIEEMHKVDKYFMYDRIEMPIEPKTVDRWLRLYGQGKGTVKVQSSDDCLKRLQKDINESKDSKERNFNSSWQHVLNIAKNTTYTVFQEAIVYLGTDGDGYYWSAETPVNKNTHKRYRIMNGGILPHKYNGEIDWSIHT